MSPEEFYGAYFATLEQANATVLAVAQQIQTQKRCIEHISSRVKSPKSTVEKLCKRGFAPTLEQAQIQLTDLIGVRLVCRFISDIYTVSQLLQAQFTVVEIKDYISHPKPNGYRSYHMILQVPTTNGQRVTMEIQLRTISQDAWACLEHQMKYKKTIHDEKLIRSELKRCADELAATDLCMQTIREFIDMDSVLLP